MGFSVLGLPMGVAASPSSWSWSLGDQSHAVVFSVGANALVGTYTIRIQGTGGGVTREATFTLTVIAPAPAEPPRITGANAFPNPVSPGGAVTISYQVSNPGPSRPVLLGASIQLGGVTLSDPANDRLVTLASGTSTVTRTFVVLATAPSGVYDLLVSLVEDVNNNGGIDSGDRNLDLRTFTGALRVAKFNIGDRVQVHGVPLGSLGLIVRDSPCGTRLAPNKFDGATGVILEGPVFCDGHSRWRIRWSDGRVGWSAEGWLRR